MNKITVKQACELAHISRPTFYKYVNSGDLSVVKDSKRTYVEVSELIRVFPDAKLNDSKTSSQSNVSEISILTSELTHRDELIKLLKQQLNDKQQDNEFLKNQLTDMSKNFTAINNILENKTQDIVNNISQKRKKFLGLF